MKIYKKSKIYHRSPKKSNQLLVKHHYVNKILSLLTLTSKI